METKFNGQQEGERVLYEVKSHPYRHFVKVGWVIILALLILILFGVISSTSSWVMLMGVVLGVGFGVIGWWGVTVMDGKSKAYITDRRVVRFHAPNPWVTNTRTLTWDEIVKIKTKSTSLIWRILGAGSVVAHARSTVIPAEGQKSEQIVTNDDIELDYVIYYQDLGNYIDKVLYLFKNNKKELAELRPFVTKPRGKRY